jgi:hypothetical protein
MDPETRLWVGGFFRWMNINLAPGNGIVPTKVLADPARAKQAAEKLRTNGERAKFAGWKTINQLSRIVPGAFWCDLFWALFEKSSFSAACLALAVFANTFAGTIPFPGARLIFI